MPKGLDLRLVLDDHATHKTAEIHKRLLKHPRFHDIAETLASYCQRISDQGPAR